MKIGNAREEAIYHSCNTDSLTLTICSVLSPLPWESSMVISNNLAGQIQQKLI